jgi:hypothetical protein
MGCGLRVGFIPSTFIIPCSLFDIMFLIGKI